jgi:ATP-dependent DNA helicase PIF1
MLLRNIDPKVGLCNGTRLICRGCFNNVIDAEVLIGQYSGTRVFLPRIPLKTTENVHLPFVMTRRQFPIRLSFALTINKAQGQTIPNVGIYLPDHVFSHGQLYVALSRGFSQSTTKILVEKGTISGEEGAHTKNIVYKEVLLPAS